MYRTKLVLGATYAEVALQFFSLAPHSDRHPISASPHCQLSGRQRRTTVHASVNIKVSSHFLIAYDSCQHCTSAVALTYPAICCCLSAATYVIHGYVAPSCILHAIFRSIIHDNPHDTYTSVPYATLTHTHACIGGTTYAAALLFTCACYTTDCLLAFVRSSLARMHIYIHTCRHRHAQAHTCNTTFLLI